MAGKKRPPLVFGKKKISKRAERMFFALVQFLQGQGLSKGDVATAAGYNSVGGLGAALRGRTRVSQARVDAITAYVEAGFPQGAEAAAKAVRLPTGRGSLQKRNPFPHRGPYKARRNTRGKAAGAAGVMDLLDERIDRAERLLGDLRAARELLRELEL